MSNSPFMNYTSKENWERIVDYKNLSEMWAMCVREYPDNIAIVDDGKSYTFKELDKEVASARAAISERGVGVGDRVGILIPNSASFAIEYLAVTTLGAVAVLLPPHLDSMTVFGCTMKFSLFAILYSGALESSLEVIKAKNPAFTLISDTERSESDVPMADVDGKAPSTVLFTGGTTGRSKGALLSNAAVMRGTKNGCYGIEKVFENKYFLVLPLTHVFGLIRNLLTSLYTGSSIFICRNNKDMFRDIAIYKPTIMVIVPALAEMALNLSHQFGRNMLGPDMKTIICGAATVAPYLVKEYEKLGVTLLPGYGLTESANLVSGNPEAKRKPEAVGFFYDGIDYKIVDGELLIKGQNVMDCYLGDPEENERAFDSEGYFKTGDLVRIDEEGLLYIVGRKKEVIVLSSGENISPAEIETKFNAIDTVQDSLVYLNEENRLTLEVLPRMAVLSSVPSEDKNEYLISQINEVNDSLLSFQRVTKIIIRTSDFLRSPSMKIIREKNGYVKS